MFIINIWRKISGSALFLFVAAVIFIISVNAAGRIMPQQQRESGYAVQDNGKNNNYAAAEEKNKDLKYSELLMKHSAEVPVLLYHHITDDVTSDTMVSPGTFEEHIKALTDNGYTGISFEQLAAYVENGDELPQNPIIITFDDGYLSNYEFAYPVLKKYNMKATIFVIGISVGKDTYRDTQDENYKMLPRFNYEQANEMIESGLIAIQSHSYDMHHWELFEELLNGEYRDGVLPLERESYYEYRENFMIDCTLAKTELESQTRTQVIAYSYPHGKYSAESDDVLREMGIKSTVTLDYGSNDIIKYMPETLYNLKRIHVNNIPAEKLLENIRNKKIIIDEE